MGRVLVRFVPVNEYGVLDHDVVLPDGTSVTNPLRVLADGESAEVVFTARRRPGVTDEEWAADVGRSAPTSSASSGRSRPADLSAPGRWGGPASR